MIARKTALQLLTVALAPVATIALAFAATLATAEPELRPQPRPAALAIPRPKPAPAPESGFVLKSVLPVEGPLKHGSYVWDAARAPAGPLVITVDLAAQTLSVFRDGHEIGVAVILYGAGDKPTPLGAHRVIWKKARHVSSVYDAPMPYTLRLTEDGVAIHGSDVDFGSATHGCIGVPTAFAKLLFAEAKLGDIVVVTDGKMMERTS